MASDHSIKNKFHYYHMANDVVMGNFIANMIGGFLTEVFISHRGRNISEGLRSLYMDIDMVLSIMIIIVSACVIVSYELPIRRCLKSYHRGEEPDAGLLELARKRLLNEPYLIVIVNFVAWIGGSFVYRALGIPHALSVGISSGLITIVLAFFWVEHVTQHHLVPMFFPNGDLSRVKGAKSISLRVRIGALIFAVSIVPLTFIHLTIHKFRDMQLHGVMTPLDLLNLIQETISLESLVFIAMGIFLSILLAHNLKKPVDEIIRVLSRVKRGDFAATARVYTNDELGFAGETLNAMSSGL